jgi:Domain of unknown function (DUF4037)
LTGQAVLEVIGGIVFSDSTRRYRLLRHQLSWYPEEVWRYVVASAWVKLGQELPFVGRCGQTGDNLGSWLVTARLARCVQHLAFLLERTWPPYPKWTSRSLEQLESGSVVAGHLTRVTSALAWEESERTLAQATVTLIRRQAEVGLPVVEPVTIPFFDRPFLTVNPAVAEALTFGLTDPWLRRLPVGIGSIEQWCDNADLLAHPERRIKALGLYRALVD